jgi:hypothetical protein
MRWDCGAISQLNIMNAPSSMIQPLLQLIYLNWNDFMIQMLISDGL